MCLQQYAKVLESEADRWAKTVPGKKCPSRPHPADVILQVLDEIRSRIPRNKLDQIPDLENLVNKVKSSLPNWPSFESGNEHKDVIDDIRNLAKLLHQSKLKEIPWDNNNPDYTTASDAILMRLYIPEYNRTNKTIIRTGRNSPKRRTTILFASITTILLLSYVQSEASCILLARTIS